MEIIQEQRHNHDVPHDDRRCTIKVTLFLIWSLSCLLIGGYPITQLHLDMRDDYLKEVFIYFLPLIFTNLMVLLWSMSLWMLVLSDIDIHMTLGLEENYLTPKEISMCALWMFLVELTSIAIYNYFFWMEKDRLLSASIPGILYITFYGALLFPCSRYSMRTAFGRIIPFQAVSFPGFLLADILTSMAQVISDMVVAVSSIVIHFGLQDHRAKAMDLVSDYIAKVFHVLPLFVRILQCGRQFYDTRETIFIYNGIKNLLGLLSLLSLPGMWTDHYQLWVIVSIAYSLFTSYWDIVMDWEFSILEIWTATFHGPQIPWLKIWLVFTDPVLRFALVYKVTRLSEAYWATELYCFVEIIRRFQWIYHRVHTEWRSLLANPE